MHFYSFSVKFNKQNMSFKVDNGHSKEGNMFELVSKYKPSGDQPKAIKELVEVIAKIEEFRKKNDRRF